MIAFRSFSGTLAIVLASRGHTAASQEVETPLGTVEFVGLHHWTTEMIQDSMLVHAPGKPLGQCAAVLRALGFPSAQALYMPSTDGRASTLVIVVEPSDSSLVRHRKAPTEVRPLPKAWRTGYYILKNYVMAYQAGAQHFGIHATGDTTLEDLIIRDLVNPRDSAQVRAFWRFLESTRNSRAAALAEHALLENASFQTRMLAAAILGAQRGRVGAWYALTNGLRDPDERVAAAAEMGLTSLLTGPQIRIDWRPAIADLRAILDGTNVLALKTTLIMLTKTKVDPALAPSLLRENGGLVVALLGSHSPAHKEAAHEFLVWLAGRDEGLTPADWQMWLHGIHARAI